MSDLVWLHLSDWHQRGPDFDRETVREALLDDLERRVEKIDRRLAEIDFIVFSGDLAFSGSPAEYESAEREFLDPVLRATGVPRDRLFIVPGNHDLSRPTLRLLAPLLSLFRREEEINSYLLDPDSREILLAPTRAYSRFIRKYLGNMAPENPSYSYLRSFTVRSVPIVLVGMNSAWMCAQHQELNPLSGQKEVRDQGYLLLGEPQFSRPAKVAEFKRAKVRIGVLHHPPDWFNKDFSRWSVETSLQRTFDFLLRGHEHESLAAHKSGPGGNCMVISAGATYDHRKHPNGYNLVHLDLEAGKGTVFFRRYDEGRGFHKDTVTTGDETPGLYIFDLPGRLVPIPSVKRPDALPAHSPLSVQLIRDAHSDDVLAALEIYAERIPPNEQFQSPDLMRWLRKDQDAMASGEEPGNFFFVAKCGNQVCGFTLLHFHPEQKLVFIAYLVAEKGVGLDHGTISSRLFAEVAKLFASGGGLTQCKGILLEVDDPSRAKSEEERRERIARIRLFCNLAERERFVLRALDFDYRQPLLEIPEASNQGQELPMLLMYAQRQEDGLDGMLPRERVQELLEFIYKWLYPEGFSEIPAENEAYSSYLLGFYASQIEHLPEKVPTLGLGKIRVGVSKQL